MPHGESVQDEKPSSLSLYLKVRNDQLMDVLQVCDFAYKHGSKARIKEKKWKKNLQKQQINTYFDIFMRKQQIKYNMAAFG